MGLGTKNSLCWKSLCVCVFFFFVICTVPPSNRTRVAWAADRNIEACPPKKSCLHCSAVTKSSFAHEHCLIEYWKFSWMSVMQSSKISHNCEIYINLYARPSYGMVEENCGKMRKDGKVSRTSHSSGWRICSTEVAWPKGRFRNPPPFYAHPLCVS